MNNFLSNSKILILIQNQSGSLAVSGGREIASTINELLSLPFALKVATKDWHPTDHISFATSHTSPDIKAFESKVTIQNPENLSDFQEIPVWPPHCVQGTKGAEIITEIDVSKFDHIVQKGRDKRVEMFSGFSTCFGTKTDAASHDLGALLQKANTDHVFVVGLARDFCVRCTAIDAKSEGLVVYIVEEAIKGIDASEDGWQAFKKEMDNMGIRVASIEGPELSLIA